MDLFLFLLRSSARTVALSVVAAILSGLSTFGVLLLVRRWMLNRQGGPESALVWAFVGCCLGALACRLVSQMLLVTLSKLAVARLSMHLSERILAAPLHRLEEIGETRLQATLVGDVATIAQGLNAVPRLCANLAMTAGCLVYLALLSLPVFGVVGGVLAVGLAVQLLLARKAQQQMRQTRDGQETLMGQFQHLIGGVKELKCHRPRREAFLRDTLQPTVDLQESRSARSQFYMALANSWGRLTFFALIGLLAIGLPALLESEHDALRGYMLAVFFLMQPVGSLKNLLPALGRARNSLEKVQALGIDLSASAEDGAGSRTRGATCWESLEMVGVTHRYRREQDERGFSLGPIDLAFRPGELVFLGGGNGSGKTTFAKLLVGLYPPRKGEIRLDGTTVTPARAEAYRQLFTIVFSEFHLFPGLLGLSTPEAVGKAREYLERLEIASRVRIRNDGSFSNTTRLSRGQRKRLALLTAITEDRPFYVFDEWAADQDPRFKEVFYTSLLPDLKARGKTVLVITHDDRYYHVADRLLIVEDGRIRDSASANAPAAHETPAPAEEPPAPSLAIAESPDGPLPHADATAAQLRPD